MIILDPFINGLLIGTLIGMPIGFGAVLLVSWGMPWWLRW